MASTKRQTSTALNIPMECDISEHASFFDLVRHLERYVAHCAQDYAPGQKLGGDNSPDEESIRFHAVNHMGFSANSVERVQISETSSDGLSKYDVFVNNMGLTGPSGTLPQHYTQLLQQRVKQNDHAFNDFLNMFNHRLVSLFYRAWKKYRIGIDYEENNGLTAASPMARALQSLTGQYEKLSYETPLYYSGHYARKARTVAALRSIIEDHLQHPVQVNSFEGRWIPIKERDRLCIGSGQYGFNNKLGDGVLAGDRAWDIQGQCSLIIGPVTYRQYDNLLPDKEAFKSLQQLLKSYVPSHLVIKLKFLIEDDQVNKQEPLGKSLRLGWNSWLYSHATSNRQATITIT